MAEYIINSKKYGKQVVLFDNLQDAIKKRNEILKEVM